MTGERIEPTDRTRVRRHAERGAYDRETVHAILDSARVCHVAWVEEGSPMALPTAFARDGESILLHGAARGRFLRSMADGRELCVTVTHVDGLVLARSTFHSSMNYRSVVILGRGEEVVEPVAKAAALDRLVDGLAPGRVGELRPSTEAEIGATTVVRVPLSEVSAKVRTGPPIDAPADLEEPVWAGVVPLSARWDEPVAAPGAEDRELPESVLRLLRENG